MHIQINSLTLPHFTLTLATFLFAVGVQSRHTLICFLSALNLGQIQWQQLNAMADDAKAYLLQRSFIVYIGYVRRYEPSGLHAGEHEGVQSVIQPAWVDLPRF